MAFWFTLRQLFLAWRIFVWHVLAWPPKLLCFRLLSTYAENREAPKSDSCWLLHDMEDTARHSLVLLPGTIPAFTHQDQLFLETRFDNCPPFHWPPVLDPFALVRGCVCVCVCLYTRTPSPKMGCFLRIPLKSFRPVP